MDMKESTTLVDWIKHEIDLINEYKKDKNNWSKNKHFIDEMSIPKEDDSNGNELSNE